MHDRLDRIAKPSSDEVGHLENEPELDIPHAVLGAPDRDCCSRRFGDM
jgi:hypothetical protein